MPWSATEVPRITLSDLSIRTAKAPAKSAVTVWDAVQPKLGLRITPAGAKSFIYMVGSGRRQVLGRYPQISLKDARTRLTRLLSDKTLGITSTAPPPISLSVSDAVTLYGTTHCDQNTKVGSAYETKRLLKNHLIPKLGRRPLDQVAKSDIIEILDGLLETPAEARHAFAAIRGFFSWSVRRGYREHSPCDRLQSPTSLVSRDRVLTQEELKAIYVTAARQSFPFGTVVQLLILTGQRRGEIGALRWGWIDEEEKTITLPASATKNSRAHKFPYGDTIAVILASVPRQGDYLFPAQRERKKGKPATTMSGWAKQKTGFDKAVATAGYKISPWTLHDLRRTFATNLAALGVRMEVTEKLLNHVSGSFGGIVGIYQRHGFQDEMREAIRLWEDRLALLVA
jgi:integrase